MVENIVVEIVLLELFQVWMLNMFVWHCQGGCHGDCCCVDELKQKREKWKSTNFNRRNPSSYLSTVTFIETSICTEFIHGRKAHRSLSLMFLYNSTERGIKDNRRQLPRFRDVHRDLIYLELDDTRLLSSREYQQDQQLPKQLTFDCFKQKATVPTLLQAFGGIGGPPLNCTDLYCICCCSNLHQSCIWLSWQHTLHIFSFSCRTCISCQSCSSPCPSYKHNSSCHTLDTWSWSAFSHDTCIFWCSTCPYQCGTWHSWHNRIPQWAQSSGGLLADSKKDDLVNASVHLP